MENPLSIYKAEVWCCKMKDYVLRLQYCEVSSYYKILNSHEAHIHQHWEAVSKRSTQQHNVQTAHCHHRHYLMKSYESKQCKDFAAFYSCLARPNNSINFKQKGKNAILRFIKNFSLSSKTLWMAMPYEICLGKNEMLFHSKNKTAELVHNCSTVFTDVTPDLITAL